jgi:putative addiction module component (TIGR02574 family)
MHPVVDELAKLPVSERLEIVQQLWDSIASSRSEIVTQPWHRDVCLASADSGRNHGTS